MKKTIMKLAGLACLLVSSTDIVLAQTNSVNITTTAVPFLRISPDARAGGMGDAGIAVLPDANSVFWDLGKMPFNKNNSGLSLNYTPWLQDLGVGDVYLASAAGFYKIDEFQTISASLRYFSLGNIQFTNDANNSAQLPSYNPREFSIDAGYSRKLSDKLGLGVALRYINSNLANGTFGGQTYKPGTAFAGDIHVFHNGLNQIGQGLNWGVTLTNLGSKISYTNSATDKDYIPATLGIGAAYTTVIDPMDKITFAMDLTKLLVPSLNDTSASSVNSYKSQGVVSSWFNSFSDGSQFAKVDVATGVEYWYNDQFAFRVGYFYENPNNGDRQYFTLGAGLKYNTFTLNFSYLVPSGNGVTRDPLSNTLRFGVLFDFDKQEVKK